MTQLFSRFLYCQVHVWSFEKELVRGMLKEAGVRQQTAAMGVYWEEVENRKAVLSLFKFSSTAVGLQFFLHCCIPSLADLNRRWVGKGVWEKWFAEFQLQHRGWNCCRKTVTGSMVWWIKDFLPFPKLDLFKHNHHFFPFYMLSTVSLDHPALRVFIVVFFSIFILKCI